MTQDSEWVRMKGVRRYATVACFSIAFALGIGRVILGMAAAMNAPIVPALVFAIGSWLMISLFIFGLTVNPGKSLYLLVILILPMIAKQWDLLIERFRGGKE